MNTLTNRLLRTEARLALLEDALGMLKRRLKKIGTWSLGVLQLALVLLLCHVADRWYERNHE